MSELLKAFSFERIKELRANAYSRELEVALKNPPEKVWSIISNSNQINALIGSDPVAYRFVPQVNGGAEVEGTSRLLGRSLKYFELPFNWNLPVFGGVERFVSQGWFNYFSFFFEVQPGPKGGSLVKLRISLDAGILSPFASLIAKILLSKLVQVYLAQDQQISPLKKIAAQDAFLRPIKEWQAQIDHLAQTWASLAPGSVIPKKAAEWLFLLPDERVARMRPYEMAAYYDLDKLEVLRFFLSATQQGFLNLDWDILCPRCRGPKGSTSSLSGLNTGYHCDTCQIDYDTLFDQNVEVTFSPTEKLRVYSEAIFCIGGPSNTPHVWCQYSLDPGQEAEYQVNLPSGEYHLSSESDRHLQGFSWSKTGEGVPLIEWDLSQPPPKLESLSGAFLKIRVTNPTLDFSSFKIDSREWLEYATKASTLANLQDFRDRFSSQVLRPGIHMGISNMVILFTDLKDSTQMYDKNGDASAFSVVQEHFEILTEVLRQNNGAMVKTIGDAIMAGFDKPIDAVKASFAFLEEIERWNKTHPDQEPVVLKIGFHQGPCIALNLNDRLDYFGGTVNKAARIQGLSQCNDLVFSQSITQDPQVSQYLESQKAKNAGLKINQFEADLKGLSKSMKVVQVCL